MSRESMSFDVIIVGAGPAGLAASIRLAQLAKANQTTLNICVIDKGAEVGSHILSGAVLEPRALDELLPHWREMNPPLHTPVTHDEFQLLTTKHAFRLPTPSTMHNAGNYIISLGQFCRFLANIAESEGVNIFPGFAAVDVIEEQGCIVGIITGDKGVDTRGEPKANYQAGMELRAKQVIFSEGCRGSLTEKIIAKFDLRKDSDPQTYGLGIKELWEVPADVHQKGLSRHSVGWPLDNSTYGGSFMYHFGENLVAIGLVVGLDYQNPYLNPYEEFQRYKSHPSVRPILEKGRRIAYGARTLVEGGIQSLPTLAFAGGLIIGDAAGFLNVPKIKGIHTAMKSAMIAAESLYPLLQTDSSNTCDSYAVNLRQSWLWDELYRVRNIRPSMSHGLWMGLALSAFDTYVLRGHAPWTLHHRTSDHLTLKKAADCKKIDYPKHDNQVTFDLSQSLFLANLAYDENQPYHLKLQNRAVAIDVNLKEYASPETRYCPAGVYEIINPEQGPRLIIHGGNCIQCKACDIKDPTRNITWTPSEGGSGPQYEMM